MKKEGWRKQQGDHSWMDSNEGLGFKLVVLRKYRMLKNTFHVRKYFTRHRANFITFS